MPLNDSNQTDENDNTVVVISDSSNPALKAKVAGDGRLLVQTEAGADLNGRLSQTDTYGRMRTVLPVELISYYFANTDHTLKMNTTQSGGSTGTVALNLPLGAVILANSTGNGHKLNFSTKKYLRYTPGQTHKLTLAARIGNAVTNVEKRWGMFTEFNGYFFKQDATGLSVVVRDGGAGDPVTETVVNQSNFNLDKLDGTGISGLNLDIDKHGIYIIDWDWHGAGSIRFGVKYNDQVVYCHEFFYDFVQNTTSTRSPSMPVDVEIKNVGVAGSAAEIKLAALSVYKDGESEIDANYSYSASRGVTSRTVGSGAETPLISLRPKLNFKGILARIGLIPSEINVISVTQSLYVRVVLNPTTITGASWTSVNAESNAEFDTSATAITGGTTVWEGYVSSGSSLLGGDIPGTREGSLGQWELGVSYTGTTADVLVVTARSLGNNSASYAAIRWLENQ